MQFLLQRRVGASSTRARLILLAAAILVPVAIFAAVLLWQFSASEREHYLSNARALSRGVSDTVDLEIVGLTAAIETLATSPSLQRGDLASFDAQARALVRTRGSFIGMRDRTGQQIIDTAVPFGTTLPRVSDPVLLATDREVFEAGRPAVSGLYTGAVTRLQLVTIDVPVRRDGQVVYVLGIMVTPQRLSSLLAAATRPEWTVALVDRNGRIIARSRDADTYVGKLATPDLRRFAADHEGSWIGRTLDGTAVLASYTRSPISGWRAAVGVPLNLVEAPLQRLTLILLGSALLVGLLSLFLAARIARTISRPIRRLATAAAHLARGEAMPPLHTGLREVDEVAGALSAASLAIDERTHELQASRASLAESQARLRAVFEAVPVGVLIAEAPLGRIVEGNTQVERILGHPIPLSQDIESYDAWAGFHADGRRIEGSEYPLARVIRGGEQRPELEALYERGDGTRIWIRMIGAPIRDAEGRLIGGVIAVLDIDRQTRAQEELRTFNLTLERRVEEIAAERDRIWRISAELMLIARFDAEIVAVNPAWTATLGWSADELVGTRFDRLVHPDDLERTAAEIAHLAEGLTTLRFESGFRHKDGSYRLLSWTAVPEAGFIHAIARDITAERAAAEALRRTEEQLHQSQKMEVLGQLTGGVAHDFNNLLTVVMGNLDIAQRRLDPGADPRVARNISLALEGARRAGTLTHRLLAFARQSALRPEPVDLNRIVAGMSELIRRTLGENIAIETVLSGGLWQVEADPSQLESAILNLCVNARDAMPDGGKLTIETANTYLNESYPAAARGDVRAGQYAMIAVSDTGAGMPPEVRERVFEPFFTTKPVGKGTGLGLSQVFGFMRQSGGHAEVYSEVGQGTTMKLYFPRLRRGHEQSSESAAAPASTDEAAGEVVLVVEDEAIVRDFTVSALEDAGYRVLEATDGPSGLALLQAHPEVALLFTDVVLTGSMNGRKVAEEAARLRPKLKVLFTTGYRRDAILHQGRLEEGVDLLTKPFTAEALVAKVQRALRIN